MHILEKVFCVRIACVPHYRYGDILQQSLRKSVVILGVAYIGDLLDFNE